MTKLVDASCESGQVTIDSQVVDGVEILSQGDGASDGIALIDRDKILYLASNASDLSDAIDKICSALTQASSGLVAAGGVLNGIAPGSGASTVAAGNAITPIVSDLQTLKGNLK